MAKLEVKYGDTICLKHSSTGTWLASSDRHYTHPNSSRQQMVFTRTAQDTACFWTVRGPDGTDSTYRTGEAVSTGAVIRLQHLNTRLFLHSHSGRPAPVRSEQQEVTAFGPDENDDWIVLGTGDTWQANTEIKLQHQRSGKVLHSHNFRHEKYTGGEQEVTCFTPSDRNDDWNAQYIDARVGEPNSTTPRVQIRSSRSRSRLVGWFANPTRAQAAIIVALIGLLSPIPYYLKPSVTAVGDISGDKGIIGRLQSRIGSSIGYQSRIYPKLFLGLRVPNDWSTDDVTSRFIAGGDVKLVKRYEADKTAIGLQFNLQPVQATYVNNPQAETANQVSQIKTLDPGCIVSDVAIGGKVGKSFEWKQSTGTNTAKLRLYLVRLAPTVEIRILGSDRIGAQDDQDFWREVDEIVDSIAFDEVGMKERAVAVGMPGF